GHEGRGAALADQAIRQRHRRSRMGRQRPRLRSPPRRPTFPGPPREAVIAPTMDLILERTTTPSDDVRTLIGELEDNLAAAYPPEQRHGLSLDAIFQPHIQ